ncbi:hypothetical protein TIFTF001_029507 [Ficus carica]|uniref:Uncharacterized protein n=1 Tax=Ficus carica TaxID=3494 RepID=A0AA88J3G3_FICCA|nr:hypothetical protein TIFTF001_029507 [Ficus carica]
MRHIAKQQALKKTPVSAKICIRHLTGIARHDHGHSTSDCQALRQKVTDLLKRGHLREILSHKGRQTYGLDDKRGDK